MHMKDEAALSPDCKSTVRHELRCKKTSTYSADDRPQTHLTRCIMGNNPRTTIPTDPAHIARVIKVVVASVPAPLGDCALVLDVKEQLGETNGSTVCTWGKETTSLFGGVYARLRTRWLRGSCLIPVYSMARITAETSF